MNPRLYIHLEAAQDEITSLVQTWSMSEIPATCRESVLKIKRHIDAAMEPVDDAVAAGLLRDAGHSSPYRSKRGDACSTDAPPIDPLGLSGVLTAEQMSEGIADTLAPPLDLRKLPGCRELNPGNDHRSGGLNHGAAIKSLEESRMDGTDRPDRWDGLSPADVEGDDPDPTAS